MLIRLLISASHILFTSTWSPVAPVTSFCVLLVPSNMHIHYLSISCSSPEVWLKVQWYYFMQSLHIYECTRDIFQQAQDGQTRHYLENQNPHTTSTKPCIYNITRVYLWGSPGAQRQILMTERKDTFQQCLQGGLSLFLWVCLWFDAKKSKKLPFSLNVSPRLSLPFCLQWILFLLLEKNEIFKYTTY